MPVFYQLEPDPDLKTEKDDKDEIGVVTTVDAVN